MLVTLLYALIFAITIALEVIIAGKSKNTKMWCVINYILLYFVSIVIGGVLGYFAGEIYAKKHMIFDVGCFPLSRPTAAPCGEPVSQP